MNRRNFLTSTSAATAAAAVSLSAQTTAQKEKTRTALIGVGNRGSYLLQGVLEQSSSASVTALCDNKPDRLDKAATTSSRDNPKTYTDWRAIIDRKDIDAVFIATPPQLHAEMAVAALDSGKHVYCEKPVGITPEQVRMVLAAAQRNPGRIFTSGQQIRSVKQMREAVHKIHTGSIGEILMVKAQRHATADLPHDGSSGDWYFDVSKSGGYLIEQSVHNVDLCNWVMQAHPWRACGFGAIRKHKGDPPGRTIYDCGSMVYEYPNHVQMSFTQNVFHPRGMPAGGQYIHVFGMTGSVDLMQAYMLYPAAQGAQPSLLAEKPTEYAHAHVQSFYECLRNGGPNPADVKVGATAALTAILGHMAMTRERVVEWTEMGVQI
jgi:predicted dehydrogenase